MMSKNELSWYFQHLGLTQVEAAQLLGVDPRTVRRWIEGAEIPGPAEQALRAWQHLHECRLAWRPDNIAIVENNQQQITAHRQHAIGLSDLLKRVKSRGGPVVPWIVDLTKRRASLGPIEVSFYSLTNGGFSVSNYTRKDKQPDTQKDWHLIEDAVYCIADAMKKRPDFGPVTLVYCDAPMFMQPNGKFGMMQMEEYSTYEKAIERARKLSKTDKFHNAFIRENTPSVTGEVLLNWPELLKAIEE